MSLEAEDSELPNHDRIELVIRDICLEYIPKRAIRVQNYHIRKPLHMGLNTSAQQL
jgi:hypothetical protein